MPRPCECDNYRHGSYTPDQCWDCWRWHLSPWWREHWSAGRPPRKPGRFSLACVLRGGPTGETRACKTCGGWREVPLYSCPVHGVCSAEGPRVEGVAWCRTCPDKRPE